MRVKHSGLRYGRAKVELETCVWDVRCSGNQGPVGMNAGPMAGAVLVSCSCCNKGHKLSGLEQQKCILTVLEARC